VFQHTKPHGVLKMANTTSMAPHPSRGCTQCQAFQSGSMDDQE
jgi:hypothetical protein